VLYVRSVESTVRSRQGDIAGVPPDDATEPIEPATEAATEADGQPVPSEPAVPTPEEVDPAIAAIRRAAAMNELFDESGIDNRLGGTIKIVMATDQAVTLRRSWPYPLAMAVRGITLEVDTSTGSVLRMGPLGIALPEAPARPKAPSEPQPAEGSEQP
jgi:hypothetical protein